MCVQESGYPSLEIPEFFVPGDTAIGTAWKAGRARDSRVQPPGGVLPERGVAFPSLSMSTFSHLLQPFPLPHLACFNKAGLDATEKVLS